MLRTVILSMWMPQVRQGALESAVAPRRVLCRYADHEGIVNLTAGLCTAPAQCGILVPQPELLVRGERFPDTDPPS